MQKLLFLAASLLLHFGLLAQTNTEPILGKWTNEDRTRVIEFVKNGSGYDAIICQAEDGSLVGKKQITGLQADGGTSFKNGTVHLIKKGKIAKCSVQLIGNDQLQLTAAYGMMSKTQTWSRI